MFSNKFTEETQKSCQVLLLFLSAFLSPGWGGGVRRTCKAQTAFRPALSQDILRIMTDWETSQQALYEGIRNEFWERWRNLLHSESSVTQNSLDFVPGMGFCEVLIGCSLAQTHFSFWYRWANPWPRACQVVLWPLALQCASQPAPHGQKIYLLLWTFYLLRLGEGLQGPWQETGVGSKSPEGTSQPPRAFPVWQGPVKSLRPAGLGCPACVHSRWNVSLSITLSYTLHLNGVTSMYLLILARLMAAGQENFSFPASLTLTWNSNPLIIRFSICDGLNYVSACSQADFWIPSP